MTDSKFWLRLSFWVGAMIDGLLALAMSFPGLFFKVLGQSSVVVDAPVRLALRMGAALMFGWALLLLWGAQKPKERRDLMLFTILIVLGLALAMIYGVSVGLVAAEIAIVIGFIDLLLVGLFYYSYTT